MKSPGARHGGQTRCCGAMMVGSAARWRRGQGPVQRRGCSESPETRCRGVATCRFGGGVCICWCEKARRGEARRMTGCDSVRSDRHPSVCQPIRRPCRRAPSRLRHMERKTAIHDLLQPVVSGRFRPGRSGREPVKLDPSGNARPPPYGWLLRWGIWAGLPRWRVISTAIRRRQVYCSAHAIVCGGSVQAKPPLRPFRLYNIAKSTCHAGCSPSLSH